VEARFSPFGDSANLDARWMHWFAPIVPQDQNLFWKHPMELLGDVGHVELPFGLFGNSVSVNARKVLSLRQMYYRLEIILGAPDGTVTILKWKLDSVLLEIVLILVHDRCTLCAERAIGS
jgi:hypothetical protein